MRRFIGRRIVCDKQHQAPPGFRSQGQGQGQGRGAAPPGRYPPGMSIRAPMDSGRALSRGGSASPSTPSGSGSSKDQMKAFIAETVVTLNMAQAQRVGGSLGDWADLSARPDSERDPRLLELRAASLGVAARLGGFLSSVNAAPPLPPLLFGRPCFALCFWMPLLSCCLVCVRISIVIVVVIVIGLFLAGCFHYSFLLSELNRHICQWLRPVGGGGGPLQPPGRSSRRLEQRQTSHAAIQVSSIEPPTLSLSLYTYYILYNI
jgi:hypothetical protein